MHIGERVWRVRDQRGLTQSELSVRSGVKQSVISRLEGGTRGNPSADIIRRLACALGCSADYLLGTFDEDSELVPTSLGLGANQR